MKDSQRARPIFEKALEELRGILDQGYVEDKSYAKAVVAGLNTYTKLRNVEIRENMLRFYVSSRISENVEGLKKTLKQQLPEYIES